MADNMELFKQFQDNPSFKKWLTNMVFTMTYNKEGKSYELSDVKQQSKVKPSKSASGDYKYESEDMEQYKVAEDRKPSDDGVKN